MQTPNLPTDSLYKYMALGGVFLMTVGVYFLSQYVYKLEDDLVRHTVAVEALEDEVDRVARLPDSEAMQIAPILRRQKDSLAAETEIAVNRADRARRWWYLAVFGALGGYLLASIGFRRWATNQSYLDQKLRNETAASERSPQGRRHKFE